MVYAMSIADSIIKKIGKTDNNDGEFTLACKGLSIDSHSCSDRVTFDFEDKSQLIISSHDEVWSSNLLVKKEVKKQIDYLVATSGGNDSIATKQLMYEQGKNFGCVYNDTGWARDDWAARIKRVSDWCFDHGIPFFITKSEGMINLVKRKKGWPMPASAMQFCTGELKEKPTLELLERIDPDGDLIIVTGRRREESQNRANLAMHQEDSPKHGGRDVYNPLVNYDAVMRNELIIRAGFDLLPHQSMECYPCVCANKTDLSKMSKDDSRIDLIERAEIEMGFTRNEKPRTMFRPYRVGGGVGVRQAIEWGHGKRGYKSTSIPEVYRFTGKATESITDVAYDEDTKAGREFSRQCDGAFCGN
jgi:3'-phosphoadenosine 5'-phosphosulfate sulfotransferase (PAPS reductase)/FAD synthetase